MSGLKMKYFILKPRGPGPYAEAARQAMLTYAVFIEDDNMTMANQLRDWVDKERMV